MLSNGYFSILFKMLEKHLWNSFLLYLVVENLQLSHEIVVSWRCSVKECSKKLLKIYRQTQEAAIQRCSIKGKYVLKNFVKFTEKHFRQSLFFNKVGGWKPETFRNSHWRYSVKQGALKSFVDFTGDNLGWSLFLVKLEFLEPATLLKNTPTQVLSCEIYSYFKENLWLSTSKLYLKRDSNTGVFLWILWIIQEHLFYRWSTNGWFWNTRAGSLFNKVASLMTWTQLTNYVIITYFFIIFWLQTNVTKNWPFYNVISVRNSNVLKYKVILTSSKNVTTLTK